MSRRRTSRSRSATGAPRRRSTRRPSAPRRASRATCRMSRPTTSTARASLAAWVFAAPRVSIGTLPSFRDDVDLVTFCSGCGRWAERRTRSPWAAAVVERSGCGSSSTSRAVRSAPRRVLRHLRGGCGWAPGEQPRLECSALRSGSPAGPGRARRPRPARARQQRGRWATSRTRSARARSAPGPRIGTAEVEYRGAIDEGDDWRSCARPPRPARALGGRHGEVRVSVRVGAADGAQGSPGGFPATA